MANTFELEATLRTEMGKGASRRLRRNLNSVPAIIYGAGKEATFIRLDHNKVSNALKNEAFYSHILAIKVGENKEQVVLKDLQRHPYRPKILHMDFLRIKADEKISMKIPLHFINGDIAPGVKVGGGVVTHHLSDVEIRCLPADLPEFIEVDLASVELNQMLHLNDLKLPKNVESAALSHGKNLPVASIAIMRVVEEPTEAPKPIETEITTGAKVEEGEGEAAPEGKKVEAKKEETKK